MYEEKFDQVQTKYCLVDGKMLDVSNAECRDEKRYVQIENASKVVNRVPVMVVGVEEPRFGLKSTDLYDVKKTYLNNTFVGRSGNGEASSLSSDFEGWTQEKLWDNFDVMSRDASDGGMIDLSNKARLKGTLTGAGIGGGVGAFTAYQGAQTEIDERWVAAVREYKDSLQKFYRGTGTRFLSFYNDTIVLPKQTQ